VQVLEDQGVGAFKASWDQLGQRLAAALCSGPDTGTRWHRHPGSATGGGDLCRFRPPGM